MTLWCVIFSLNSFAQYESEFYYQNAVFKEGIKSVQLYKDGFELSHPIINLNSDESLVLKFDELTGDVKNYFYTIIHCDANWEESFILQDEYLNGFFDNPLDDYAPSFNTTMQYVNYRLVIPNDRVQIKKSGNFVLVVYEDESKENLVLTRRFHVLDQKVDLSGIVKRATFDPFKGDNQEVDFEINHEHFNISNPMEDVKVVIMKNRRWDNAITDLKPLFIKGAVLDYNYGEENVFKGGNEYRYFDARTYRYTGENVLLAEFFNPYYHITIKPDEIRSTKKYFEYEEMDGNYIVQSSDRNVDDPDTECDYVFVHFTLKMESQLLGGTVNVFGALTNWNANRDNEMTWNYDLAAYELTLLLKQGYYNYQYVYVPEGASEADETVLEGSHYETGNEYQILVYYKSISGRYDELIGYKVLNSGN